MKKISFVIVALCLACTATAQVHFGVKAGFDLTHFWGDAAPHRVTPNYQVGALMEYKFNDYVGISPELVFAAQGSRARYRLDDKSAKGSIIFHTNYINLPIMLKIYANPKLAFDFGPQVGFNVYSKATAKATVKNDGAKVSAEETEDLKEHTKAADFGVGVGATYSITNHAFVQARYTLGVTDVFDGGFYNGNGQIAFGWRF